MWSSNGREQGVGRGYAHSTARKRPRSTSTRSAQFFYCFGCHEKGDAITFLTKIEQRPFMDVLQDLAGRGGRRSATCGRCRRRSGRPGRRPSPSATGCSARWSWRPASSKSSTRRRRAPPRAPTSRSAASAPPCASGFRVGYAPAALGRAVVAPRGAQDPAVGPGAAGPGGRQRARPLRLLPRPRDAAGASIARSG